MTLLIALQGFENFAMRGAEMQLQQQQQHMKQHMKQQQSSSGGGVPQLAVGRSPVPAGPAAGLLTSSPSWPAWLSLRSCDWQGKGARGRGPGTLALNPCPKLSLHRLHGLRFIGVSASSSNAGLIRCMHT